MQLKNLHLRFIVKTFKMFKDVDFRNKMRDVRNIMQIAFFWNTNFTAQRYSFILNVTWKYSVIF